jgi:hypothetical protein
MMTTAVLTLPVRLRVFRKHLGSRLQQSGSAAVAR